MHSPVVVKDRFLPKKTVVRLETADYRLQEAEGCTETAGEQRVDSNTY